MAENSGIEWTHHTFNPVVGCTKVSQACDFCYAETWAKRSGQAGLWNGERRKTKTWGMPVKWNKEAAEKGIRYRVFCASLADVFDNQWEKEWRDDLWKLIKDTPHLDWLLLTKRPQNIKKMLPDDWGNGYENVWLGATVENQKEADRRLPHLTAIPAKIRFLSCEPLFEAINISEFIKDIHWVIAGGESGPNYRHNDALIYFIRGLRDQCTMHDIPFLFKQWQGKTQPQIKAIGREVDGVVWNEYPKGTVK